MKKYLFMLIAAIIFLNVWGSSEVSAQSLKAIEAEVEFDFRVGDKVYPAGVYRLESGSQTFENLLILRGTEKNNRQLLVVNSTLTGKRHTPKLVFRQVGDEYYLTDIFLSDGKWGFSVRQSRKIENGKKLASAKSVEVSAKN